MIQSVVHNTRDSFVNILLNHEYNLSEFLKKINLCNIQKFINIVLIYLGKRNGNIGKYSH